ncbi:hypothetical protein F8M41_010049 [Gigaspora margarita]|uniref:Uncharacterized protein n=1 Tax=Gigaspora margarita TaxID=4874 RepID=A0A8H3X303_GIGMA|nr:hypothetical protein F8M41_010049 [Gigaspora margarita]
MGVGEGATKQLEIFYKEKIREELERILPEMLEQEKMSFENEQAKIIKFKLSTQNLTNQGLELAVSECS